MFVEQRIYTCAPGNTGEFLRSMRAEAFAAQTDALGHPVGYYVNEIGPLNQIITLWAYGTLDERVESGGASVPGCGLERVLESPATADDAGNAHPRAGAVLRGAPCGHRGPREDTHDHTTATSRLAC